MSKLTVRDFVIKEDKPNNKFIQGQEYIISTVDYIFFNCYNRFILNYPVLYTFKDSKGVLHIVC